MIVMEGQYRYTPEQADALAEDKGYGDLNGAALMEDLDYFVCCDCGDYVVEPGGWNEQYHGVLCARCAAPLDEAQCLHEAAGRPGLIWAAIPEADEKDKIVEQCNSADHGRARFFAEQYNGLWWLFKKTGPSRDSTGTQP